MKMHGVIAPSCLCRGLFAVGAIDNLDHNPSSTTSTDSFRGTGISLFQFPAQVKTGLHESYASVSAVVLTTSATVVPKCQLKPAGPLHA